MKTRKASSCRTAVVKNRKYYIMQVVEYICIGTMAFFSNDIVSLFSRFLTGMFSREAVETIRFMAKLMYLIAHVLVFAMVELFFRRKVLDYETVER